MHGWKRENAAPDAPARTRSNVSVTQRASASLFERVTRAQVRLLSQDISPRGKLEPVLVHAEKSAADFAGRDAWHGPVHKTFHDVRCHHDHAAT